MLKAESEAKRRLAITRAKAKDYEYDVPIEDHINVVGPLEELIDLTLGILGELSTKSDLTQEAAKESLLFSASYFDALLSTHTTDSDMDYLRLLGATAFYLADYPGSAKVLAKQVTETIDLGASALDRFLFCLLADRVFYFYEGDSDKYFELRELGEKMAQFVSNGSGESEIEGPLEKIRRKTYGNGTDRELLLADLIVAVVHKKISISTWLTLPSYTDLSQDVWRSYLQREGSLRELWPSQILLGQQGIFKGKSAVVQMPTSAGKTKSAELLIRSAFLSGRAKSAIIVAPFRALCQEIFNTLAGQFKGERDVSINIVSDVLQNDFLTPTAEHQILILTPEKLDYLLRHNPGITTGVGLVIYDEGHLFDDPERGIKFELLLTSLKNRLSSSTQIVLISAVMQNSEDIGNWLLGDEGVSVQARDLNPTRRSLAFVSWLSVAARLEFMEEKNIDENLFFVPRVIEPVQLSLHGREKKERFFPEKGSDGYDSSQVSVALGFKVLKEGSVAIFTGRKDSISLILHTTIDAIERGFEVPSLEVSTEPQQAERLIRYISLIYGEDSDYTKGANIGMFAHHGSIPHGLRLSVEHALQKKHIKFVVCTSTLAQGVNLPIRYLIISTDRQGPDRIKVRDLHNLMGRAGRAGVYTEGTVIFANPAIYDRKNGREKWRWASVKEMLDPSNSEACESFILQYFKEEPVDIAEKSIWTKNRAKIRNEISSYLLDATSDLADFEGVDESLEKLAEGTLAYSQADEEKKILLKELFREIGREIFEKEPSAEKRQVYAKSIVGIDDAKSIDALLTERIEDILAHNDDAETLLPVIWDILCAFNKNRIFQALPPEVSLALCRDWISGGRFQEMEERLSEARVGTRKITIDHVVDLCEGAFGFNNSLILGTCNELLKLIHPGWEESSLLLLQKMLKYGLPSRAAIFLYERGLSDRTLALGITALLNNDPDVRDLDALAAVQAKSQSIIEFVDRDYPDYFSQKLRDIL